MVHCFVKGRFIAKYFFKSARWVTDLEEKAKTTVIKRPCDH